MLSPPYESDALVEFVGFYFVSTRFMSGKS